MATVTITLEELDTIRLNEKKAYDEVAMLQRQIVDLKRADPTTRIQRLEVLSRNLIDVMRFAIANLAPEISIGWKAAILRAIALDLQYLPDHNSDDVTLASELNIFANEVDRINAERAAKRKIAVASAP